MRRWMVILLAVLCFSGISQGQNASLPLVLEVDGDIWTWKAGDAALTRLTVIWSRADALVSYARQAHVPGVAHDDELVFDDLGHLALLVDRRVADAIIERLR